MAMDSPFVSLTSNKTRFMFCHFTTCHFKRHLKTATALLSISFAVASANASEILKIFEDGDASEWKQESFKGFTSYEPAILDGATVLKATSNGTASGLFLKKRIDLLQTPFLNWKWQVSEALPKLDEQSKEGDDYAARIYVVIDGGLMAWRTRSLNYVWSGSQQAETFWDNAFVGSNVCMVAVRGEDALTQTWYSEKRNVYQDLITYLGDKGSKRANERAYRYIDVVAIMTDTDNSQASATTYYGDISFSAQ
ncbi:DUF3047 domain-containing protein [Vibrio nigripulchritudo]|uniref:DUF3047 domain-containing protein n=2 Tax=Vibrio nigripulchritudo TaxID=28173 RepID=UPI0003B1A551|nr:DUF3047 domain-containing protein [Vibrio nigripulchritudo]CCN49905.1 conserved hypothetical protein [Vibrio nigripulchritudo MADA3020]